VNAQRTSRRGVALSLVAAGGLAAALAWGFATYFRPDLLVGFVTWVRSCF
jgi:hypothetical protein